MTSEDVKAVVKELIKHAKRDGCYGCKRLLRKMHVDPDKEFPAPTQ